MRCRRGRTPVAPPDLDFVVLMVLPVGIFFNLPLMLLYEISLELLRVLLKR